jgi:hypothetical protein
MILRTALAMLLALLIPGGGHFYLGLRARAAGFFLIVSLMFFVGVLIEGGLYTFQWRGLPLLRLFASVASMGSGLLYAMTNVLGAEGNVASATFEYGRTFTLTAGLMNLLLVLDCFDIAQGRKD